LRKEKEEGDNMKTNKEWTKNLKNKIITEDVIDMVLFSLNKRAKNCREKKKENYQKSQNVYGKWKEIYHNACKKYKEKEMEYYEEKSYVLKTLFKPIEKHKIHGQIYLFYKISEKAHSYHMPVFTEEEQNLCAGLVEKELENFETDGKDILELASVPFCRKVIKLIEEGNFEFRR
jgi:hypothetical protein